MEKEESDLIKFQNLLADQERRYRFVLRGVLFGGPFLLVLGIWYLYLERGGFSF